MSKPLKLLKAGVVKKINKLSQTELVELVLKLGKAINNIDDASKNHFTCGCCGERNWSSALSLELCNSWRSRRLVICMVADKIFGLYSFGMEVLEVKGLNPLGLILILGG
jgi:hypothetical protein